MAGYPPEIDADLDGLILATVRQAQRVSRTDLLRQTGLSRTVLEARLGRLRARGLLTEAATGTSTGGRRPRLVAFRKDAGFVVSVDLGLTSVDVAITDLGAHAVVHHAEPVDIRDGPVALLDHISTLIERVMAAGGVAASQIKGLGLGIPGAVAFRTGVPVSPPDMPGWHHFPIRDYLGERFGWPVFVDNDANLMALGERWAGLGRTVDTFLWIKLGTGIGCGIVCDGRLYRGADGCAGDIGHSAVGDEQVVCSCGNRGCLGQLAGGEALARHMEQAARAGASPYLAGILAQHGRLEARDLSGALAYRDPYAAQVVRAAGAAIGAALASLVNFYNPRLIVVGGGLAQLGDLLLAAIREAVYRRSAPLATRHLAIQQSSLGDTAGIIGASALVLGELYKLAPLTERRVSAGSARDTGAAPSPGST